MSLPRMSWHIGDYHKDTGHLCTVEHGAYFLLCLHYWATGGLPNDDKQLASITRMTGREWAKAKPVLKPLFKAGEWKHKRIEIELADAQAKYEKRAEAGSKGGKAKANGKQCSSNATAESYQPITDNPKEEKDNAPSGATKFAFESGCIRLNAKNLAQWKAAFLNLNLEAELLGLTDWAGKQGNNWFVAVSGALAKRNREIGIRQKQSGPKAPLHERPYTDFLT